MSYLSSVMEQLERMQELELQEMTKELGELRNENEDCKKENGALQQQIRVLNLENGAFQHKNEELKSENETFQQQNDELKSESKTLTSIIEELTDKLCEKPKPFTHIEQFNGLQTPENVSYISVFFKLYFDYII